jgi:uncharacterized protein (UPF0332 family)
MKPGTLEILAKAEVSLKKAEISLSTVQHAPFMAEEAARLAYYAAFHAAQAFVFERSDKLS